MGEPPGWDWRGSKMAVLKYLICGLGLHLLHLPRGVALLLHLSDQLSVFGFPEGLPWVQRTAHSRICRDSLEDVGTIHLIKERL